jgi:hypothetical protein
MARYAVQTMHGAPTHGVRRYRGSYTQSPGPFTQGNSSSGITRAQMNEDLNVSLDRPIPIRRAHRPYADTIEPTPDGEVTIIRVRPNTCPGCGIVRPVGRGAALRPCDQCFD